MISGKTRLFAILAHPCGHVRTPQALNALFAEKGIDAVMTAYDVAPEDLAEVVGALRRIRNLDGLVITVPHKSAMMALCDEVSTRARVAGAVNVVRRTADGRLSGDLLDGIGFVTGLRQAGHSVAGRNVYMVGAGGAASAIAFALAAEGVGRLTLANRSPEKLEALADRLRAEFPDVPLALGGQPSGHDIVINATSLGLKAGDPLPVDPEQISPDTLVAEVIMEPAETALLQATRAKGCPVHPGRAMLDGQLAEIFAFLVA